MTIDSAPAPASAETSASPSDAPAAGDAARARLVRWAIGAGLFALAVVLPLLRQTGVHSWRTIWAEDGAVYYGEATEFGGFTVLFRGYAGYLQLPPRLLALPAPYVPAKQLSIYFALSSAVVAALLALFLYRATHGWIGSVWARLSLAALLVLMPCLIVENIATITNVIWVFAAVTPWAIVSLAEKKSDIVARGAVGYLAATSSALACLFAPLAIGWAIYRRTRAAYIVSGVYLAGVLTQGWVVTHTKDHDREPFTNSVNDFSTLIGQRIFGQYLVGERGILTWWANHGTLLIVLSTVVVLACLAVSMIGAERRNQVLALVFLAYAFITFAFPVWGRGTSTIQLEAGVHHTDATRYSVIPVLLVASAFAVLLAPVGATAARKIARIGRPIFVAQLALVMLFSFSMENARSLGPGWPEAMADAYQNKCDSQPKDDKVPVTISPFIWSLPVPCKDIAPG